MNPQERASRANRAELAYREFMEPMLDELKNVYSERLVEVANAELSRDKRADKITALSNALKILSTLDAGMQTIMRDGEVANAEMLKADRIEKMPAPQRRLLGIAPY